MISSIVVAVVSIVVGFFLTEYAELQNLGVSTSPLVAENEKLRAKLDEAEARIKSIESGEHALARTWEARLETIRQEVDKEPKCNRLKLDGLTQADLYRTSVEGSFPAIVEGGIKAMGRLEHWMEVNYLKQQFGDTLHNATSALDDRFVQPQEGILEFPAVEAVRLQDFIEELSTARNDPGLRRTRFIEQSPLFEAEGDSGSWVGERSAMMSDVQVPDFAGFLKKDLVAANLWLGYHGANPKQTALHYDGKDSLFVQLTGNKTFVMYHPLEMHRLYPTRMDRVMRKTEKRETTENYSPVFVDLPDATLFPRFKREDGITCTLQPGDVMFIPAFTWHHVYSYQNRSQGANCAVNLWFKPMMVLEKYFDLVHQVLLDKNAGLQ